MAHVSGTFSHPKAGRLTVRLTGTFHQGAYRDSGFPNTTAPANLLIRAFMGPDDGTRQHGEPIDRYAPISIFEMDYPGGSAPWPYGTEEVAHQHPSGVYTYGMAKLLVEVTLTMR